LPRVRSELTPFFFFLLHNAPSLPQHTRNFFLRQVTGFAVLPIPNPRCWPSPPFSSVRTRDPPSQTLVFDPPNDFLRHFPRFVLARVSPESTSERLHQFSLRHTRSLIGNRSRAKNRLSSYGVSCDLVAPHFPLDPYSAFF